MKKLTALLTIFALLTAATAFAQDNDPDGIGVYFDLDGLVTCHYTAAPFEQVTAYLLATNVSDATGISGWEAVVSVGGAPVAPAWTLAAGLDVDPSDTGFQVGIGVAPAALPSAPAVVLATWAGFIMAPTDIVDFTVSDVPGSVSFAGTPGYASGSDAGLLIPFQVSSGYPYVACAQINACDVVANEDMSWSQVKDLFQ